MTILYAANLQHAIGTDNAFSTERQAAAMADADIICAQECSVGDLGTWDTSFSARGLTRQVFDEHPAGTGDGNAIWTRTSTVTTLQAYTIDLEPAGASPIFGWDGSTDIRRSNVAVKVKVGGRVFYVVSVHLVSASGEDNSNTNFAAQRVQQINSLISWGDTTLTGAPRILAGDFNIPINYPRAPERSYTADAATDTLTSAGHGFPEDTAVALRTSGGAAPGGLSTGDSLYATAPVYYTRDVTADTFRLAATPGGAPIDITSNGSGSNFVAATQWDLLRPGYVDLWQEALRVGKAVTPWADLNGDSQPDMTPSLQLSQTHDSRNIDRIHLSKADLAGFNLKEFSIPDHRVTCSTSLTGSPLFCPDTHSSQRAGNALDYGVRPSDHNFLRLDFTIGAAPIKSTQFSWGPLARV